MGKEGTFVGSERNELLQHGAAAAAVPDSGRSARRVLTDAGSWLLDGCAAAAGYKAAHHYADCESKADDPSP